MVRVVRVMEIDVCFEFLFVRGSASVVVADTVTSESISLGSSLAYEALQRFLNFLAKRE